MIFNFNNGAENSPNQMESFRDDETNFINDLVEVICKILDVSYKDKRLVESLLKHGLKEALDTHFEDRGLLQQYQAAKLENATERIRNTLKVPKDVKVNHDNADHAKYADIVKWIADNYELKQPKTNLSKEKY